MTGKGSVADADVCAIVVARIGDTLLVTPALRALRAVCRRLTVLVHPQREAVLRNLEFIDELGSLSKRTAWFRSYLRTSRHDMAICWGREPALLQYCLRTANTSIAFDYPEFSGIRSSKFLRVDPPPDKSMHAVDERNLLLAMTGVSCDDPRLAYVVSKEEAQVAQAWLKSRTGTAKPLIGLQPFSFHTKAHRDWPLDRFVELAMGIRRSRPDAHFLLLGDENAAARAQDFLTALPGQVSIAAGQFNLRGSAALMKQLDLYVGVDTGPTHIAGALGIPMVGLYHPQYPAKNLQPLDNPVCIAIEASGAGMDSLGVNEVLGAALRLLEPVRHIELATGQ